MKILNLRFKEVKDLKKEMLDGLHFLYSDDCYYSMVKEGKTYFVIDHRKESKKNPNQYKMYSFDDVDSAIKKFKKLCRIK